MPEFIAPASDLEQESSTKGSGFIAPTEDMITPLRRGAPVPTPEESRANLEAQMAKAGGLAPLGIEIGSQIYGQTTAGQIGGGFYGGLGNVAAQGLRVFSENRPYNPVETAQAAAWGMLPGASEVQTTGRYLAPGLASRMGEYAKEMGRLSLAGGTISGFPLLVGEKPSQMDIVMGLTLPPAIGSAAKFLGSAYSAASNQASKAAEYLQQFGQKDIRPTPGMVEPGRFARLEQRTLREEPTGALAEKVNRVYEKLGSGIEDIAASPNQAATVFEGVSQRVNEPIQMRERLARLGPDVEKANAAADAAAVELRRMTENVQRGMLDSNNEQTKALMMRQRDASNDALNRSISAARQKAIEIETNRISEGGLGVNPAQARDQIVENVIKPVEDAYERHWNRMFDTFPADAALFDTKDIVSKGKRMLEDIGGQMSGDASSTMKSLIASLDTESGKASLSALRRVRDNLLKKARYGDPDTTLVEGELKQFAGLIGEELNSQASEAFGPELAKQFQAVNQDYRNYSTLWDANGMKALFAKNPNDSTITRIVSGIKESGVDAEEFKNLRSFISNLAVPQQARVVSDAYGTPMLTSFAAQVDPILASAMKNHVNEIIRGNIINQAVDNGRVDARKLVSVLSEVGRDPRVLPLLRLPSNSQIEELRALVQNYPEASRMTPDQWTDLLKSRTFMESFKTGETISNLIRPIMQESALQSAMERSVLSKNAGRLEAAAEARKRAFEIAGAARKNLDDVTVRMQEMERDPVYQVFQARGTMGVSTQSYEAMAKSLFDPAPGALTNEYVKEITTALRENANPGSKQLLKDLQGRYILDRVMATKDAPTYSAAPKRFSTDSLLDMLTPLGGSSAKAEIARAEALLEPEQMKALREFADIAQTLRKWESVGKAEEAPTTLLGKTGFVRRGMNAVVDLWRRGEYDRASQALLDPETYADKILVNGEWLKSAAETARGSIGPLTSRAQQEAKRRQQPPMMSTQAPASMANFLR